MDTGDLWRFLLPGYLLTVALEAPVLFVGLSARHARRTRVLAAWWLTACTYPIVVLVLPLTPGLSLAEERWRYVAVAETFAPLAECVMFRLAYGGGAWSAALRDYAAIVAANLVSFLVGGWLWDALMT